MRQSGDKKYASLLADLRTGCITDKQHAMLSERFITPGHRASVEDTCNKYTDLSDSGQTPVILLPRTATCQEINSAMLQRIGNTVQNITATDTLGTIVEKKLLPKIPKALTAIENDTSRTAGLEKV